VLKLSALSLAQHHLVGTATRHLPSNSPRPSRSLPQTRWDLRRAVLSLTAAESDDSRAARAGPPRDPGELPRRAAAPARDGAAGKPARGRLWIGLQDSCHLRNGLDVWREPRELIARVGEYVELPSAAACCGAAGSYAIVRPEDSARVLDRHLDEIADADLDVIAVVNPGCYRQLQRGVRRRRLRTRVVHLAELLAGER
jgi:hypothetical protein